jgi:hypothetical protein
VDYRTLPSVWFAPWVALYTGSKRHDATAAAVLGYVRRETIMYLKSDEVRCVEQSRLANSQLRSTLSVIRKVDMMGILWVRGGGVYHGYVKPVLSLF